MAGLKVSCPTHATNLQLATVLGSPVFLLPLTLNRPCLFPACALWLCRVISTPDNSYSSPDGVMVALVTCGP